MDGSNVRRDTIIATVHHDYLYLPDGSMAWIDFEDRDYSGRTVRGETIVERDPAGVERVVWSAWDDLTYNGVDVGAPEGYWTLGNHPEYVAAADSHAMSLRNLDTIVKVDRATGVVDWTVGPNGTNPPDDPTDGQHGLDVLGDELLVFDNGSSGSRAVRYLLTEGAATLIWEYHHGALSSFVMGDAQQLDNGNHLVVFSTSSTVDEVSPEGEQLASFSYAANTTLGFVERHDSLVE